MTAGTQGLSSKPKIVEWLVQKVVFGLMVLLGKAQTAAQGARKYADCLESKVGRNGEVIGAPKGKTLGKLSDQVPMNPAMSDPALRETFWRVVNEVAGPIPA